jgi:DNA-binding CsgD family transcriptional regulator
VCCYGRSPLEKNRQPTNSGRERTKDTQPDPRQKLGYREVLLETLDRMGCGGVILDTNGELIASNSVAMEIAKRRGSPETELLNAIYLPQGANDWVTSWQETEHPLAVVRIPAEQDIVLLVVDLEKPLLPSTQLLRRIFGLTPAESKVVYGLASGFSPNDVANNHGVRKTTVRTQLASVFAKTHTTSQTDLIGLLARLAILSRSDL